MREDILRERYFRKDPQGNIIEDWRALCARVSEAVAKTRGEREDFFTVMHECLFLPNTPALTNAGRPDFTLSACFVLPVEDSIEGIFDAAKQAALVHKMGGGTGFSFSRLRPAGDKVGTTNGLASGPCSFMRIFNTSTEVMKQGGTRRGANMGMLRVDHPDILDFITLKSRDGDLGNFNISVAVTDEFMDAVKTAGNFTLRFNGETRRTLRAWEIWDKIVEMAWLNGEPGIFFIDRANRYNPTPHVGEFEATNPCGEQMLLPYEACVLGSVNLARMVTTDNEVDWGLLRSAVKTAVAFLDSIIDRQAYPLPEIERMHKGNRKIGLGVMGWADMLIRLGVSYASEPAITLAEKVMSFITGVAVQVSAELAKQHGPFPNWEGSAWAPNSQVRNATLTTMAPTGSISIIAGVSSGIEPVFDFETEQKRADRTFTVRHPFFEEWRKAHPGEELPDYFIKAADVPVEWHIRMQAAFQKHTHNAISKTVILPHEATRADVEKAFLLAYDLGCKGLTVYRDGSRKNQVISSRGKRDRVEPVDLPKVRDQKLVEVDTSEGRVFVHITMAEKEPLEVFITSPVESKHAETYEALAMIMSDALRCGRAPEALLRHIQKANMKHGSVVSPTYAILRAFRMLGVNGSSDTCEECGGVVVLQEGCRTCLSCGASKC
ncbi:MAG: Ribonucleoside-diphosphate reductase NrdZ [Syntrophorhabdus sp. PtaB.Bin184]|nr:MAG: Ribonucleoside-diphosphate reductase NrdZ [Syntrophorhabdus sp. PtaB.Bin184]